ncbi:MAG: preQ(1) synthase [Elusimicrobiota bacterium]
MKKDKLNFKPVFDKITPSFLTAMPYDYKGKNIEINVESEEFTCLCPWSGLPDFALLTVNYTPDRNLIELKSLKYYLQSFRMVGIVHENAVNRILEDLVRACKPKSMTVELVFNIRGGVKTTVRADYKK